MASKPRCRHERNSWIIVGGYAEWCFVCGAFRNLKRISPSGLAAASEWFKPSGDKNVNPAMQEKRDA